MKQIQLSNSDLIALIDDEDYARVSQLNWRSIPGKTTVYAEASHNGGNVKMHQWIIPGHPMLDHRDGNGLHNFRSNLRPANNSQNQANKKKYKPNGSPYKGVIIPATPISSWAAMLRKGSRVFYRGKLKTEVEAALAYNEMAVEHFGEFARLNVVPETAIKEWKDKSP